MGDLVENNEIRFCSISFIMSFEDLDEPFECEAEDDRCIWHHPAFFSAGSFLFKEELIDFQEDVLNSLNLQNAKQKESRLPISLLEKTLSDPALVTEEEDSFLQFDDSIDRIPVGPVEPLASLLFNGGRDLKDNTYPLQCIEFSSEKADEIFEIFSKNSYLETHQDNVKDFKTSPTLGVEKSPLLAKALLLPVMGLQVLEPNAMPTGFEQLEGAQKLLWEDSGNLELGTGTLPDSHTLTNGILEESSLNKPDETPSKNEVITLDSDSNCDSSSTESEDNDNLSELNDETVSSSHIKATYEENKDDNVIYSASDPSPAFMPLSCIVECLPNPIKILPKPENLSDSIPTKKKTDEVNSESKHHTKKVPSKSNHKDGGPMTLSMKLRDGRKKRYFGSNGDNSLEKDFASGKKKVAIVAPIPIATCSDESLSKPNKWKQLPKKQTSPAGRIPIKPGFFSGFTLNKKGDLTKFRPVAPKLSNITKCTNASNTMSSFKSPSNSIANNSENPNTVYMSNNCNIFPTTSTNLSPDVNVPFIRFDPTIGPSMTNIVNLNDSLSPVQNKPVSFVPIDKPQNILGDSAPHPSPPTSNAVQVRDIGTNQLVGWILPVGQLKKSLPNLNSLPFENSQTHVILKPVTSNSLAPL